MYLTYSVVTGLGYGFVYNVTLLVALASFVKWRAVAVGFISSANSAGLLVVSQTNSVYLREFGWRVTFRIMAAMMVLSLLCSLAFRPFAQKHNQKAGDTRWDNENNHGPTSNTHAAKSQTDGYRKNSTENLSSPLVALRSNGDSPPNKEHINCEEGRCSEQTQNKFRTVSLFQNRRFMIFTSSATVVCLPYFMFIVHVVSWFPLFHYQGIERRGQMLYMGNRGFWARLVRGDGAREELRNNFSPIAKRRFLQHVTATK